MRGLRSGSRFLAVGFGVDLNQGFDGGLVLGSGKIQACRDGATGLLFTDNVESVLAGLFGGRMDAGGNFTLKGYFRFSDSVRTFAVNDEVALVSTERSVYVVDIRDEYSFQNLGEVAFSGVTEIVVAPPNLWAGYSATAGWSVLPLPRFLSPAEKNLPKNESKASPSGNSYKLHVFNDRDVKTVAGTVTLPSSQIDQPTAGGAIVY